jgi:uncharacterized membrane protein
MTCRRHGSKVTFALWSLVVVALLASGLGVVRSLILMGVLGLVAGAATTVWVLSRRTVGEKKLPEAETGALRSRA